MLEHSERFAMSSITLPRIIALTAANIVPQKCCIDDGKSLCLLQQMDLSSSFGAPTVVLMSLTTRTLHIDISTSAIGSVRTPPHVYQ
jgi:hypothetical protein